MAKPKSLPYEAGENAEAYCVTLHNTSGGADKLYMLSIGEAPDNLWFVNYANGRRGGTLTSGTKTKEPVPYADARKICNNQLFEKVGGGYFPIGGSRLGEGMTAEAISTAAREASGYMPQLLLAVDEDDVETLIEDDAYVAQRKMDGERRFLIVSDGVAGGGNRKGQTVALPSGISAEAAALEGNVVLDGEQIGDVFWYWDMVVRNGCDMKTMPLKDRLEALSQEHFAGATIRPVATAYGTEAKRRLLEEVRDTGGEGLVFKRLDAAYEPGKPGSKATWRKFKFWQSLSAVVGTVNSQRSVGLELFESDGSRIAVGNVTIPANKEVPAEGDIVEVSYLYAYDGGSLFQPAYIGKRDDIDISDCLAAQRVFKTVDEETPVLRM